MPEHKPESEKERAWWAWWQTHGEAHLTLLLREDWNPTGLADTPASEYATYATRLGGLLREGISEDEVARFLTDARTGAMGLPAAPQDDQRVAAAVHSWYVVAHRAAE